MNWRTFSIRTRILWGYTLILGLVFGLLLYMVWNMINLNQRIQLVQRNVTMDVDIAVGLSEKVTHSQSMVDRYLQQPSAQNLLAAQSALRDLTATIAATRTSTATRAAQLEELAHLIVAYETSFETMRRLLGEQAPIHDSLQVQLTSASTSIDAALLSTAQEGTLSLTMLRDAAAVQENLRDSTQILARMTSQNSDRFGLLAQEEVQQARDLVRSYADDTSGEAAASFATANRALGLVEVGLGQITSNFQQVADQYTTLMNEQGIAIQALVVSIEQAALDDLAIATQELEQQTRQLWLMVLLALLGIPGVAMLLGVRQARAISGPITALVGATAQIPRGNYDVLVDEQVGGESGQLARAFNQMAATLKAQRTDLQQQQDALQAEQAATAQRNSELEQALYEIQVATTARDALAQTVRELSVPIIPILEYVIVLPLVGEVDAARTDMLMDHLLAGISTQRAHIAIIDLTGVPYLDALVAKRLIEATTAARLLGARVVLVGIRPALAEALLATGTDLSALVTRANLRSAVEYALEQQTGHARRAHGTVAHVRM